MHTLITLASSEPAATSAATGVTSYAWLLLAFPLFGAALLLFGGRVLDKAGPMIAVLLSWAACVVGVLIAISMMGADPSDRSHTLHLFSWVPAGTFDVNASLLLDPL